MLRRYILTHPLCNWDYYQYFYADHVPDNRPSLRKPLSNPEILPSYSWAVIRWRKCLHNQWLLLSPTYSAALGDGMEAPKDSLTGGASTWSNLILEIFYSVWHQNHDNRLILFGQRRLTHRLNWMTCWADKDAESDRRFQLPPVQLQ